MQTSADVLYLDSSALLKLVIGERESKALPLLLTAEARRVSSALARVEVVRAARPHGDEAVVRAREVLAAVDLIRLDDEVLDLAGRIGPLVLRSLDAVHLATASRLAPGMAIVTYDHRLQDAAQALGLGVLAPAP